MREGKEVEKYSVREGKERKGMIRERKRLQNKDCKGREGNGR